MSQCEGCAFKPGADANREPYNNLRGQVCALGAIPFYCHHNVNWEENQKLWVGDTLKQNCRTAGICQGWKSRVAELHKRGFFGEFREIRRIIAQQCLSLIEHFTDDKAEKKKIGKKIRRMLRFLAAEDIGDKEIPL